jgi:hypothetical protein
VGKALKQLDEIEKKTKEKVPPHSGTLVEKTLERLK